LFFSFSDFCRIPNAKPGRDLVPDQGGPDPKEDTQADAPGGYGQDHGNGMPPFPYGMPPFGPPPGFPGFFGGPPPFPGPSEMPQNFPNGPPGYFQNQPPPNQFPAYDQPPQNDFAQRDTRGPPNFVPPQTMGPPQSVNQSGMAPPNHFAPLFPIQQQTQQTPQPGSMSPDSSTKVVLIYNDDDVSMEEKRADLDRYSFTKEKVQRQMSELDQTIASRLDGIANLRKW